jgi:hypothetical protein
MTKIVKIRFENFKAIDLKEMNFAGLSAIITGGNNKGKTSFLRGVADRIRFDRPQIKVRQGATEGMGEMLLDSGERVIWEFDDDKKDKLTLISPEGTKAIMTKDLGAKFFPPLFDIDKFLQSSPKDQVKQLQKIVGLDFTEVEKRRDEAYKERYKANEESERYRVKLSKLMKCDPVTTVDVELLNIKRKEIKAKQEVERIRLNDQYLAAKKNNDAAIALWEGEKIRIENDCAIHNKMVEAMSLKLISMLEASKVFTEAGYTGSEMQDFMDQYSAGIEKTKKPQELYPARPELPDPMPTRDTLDAIEKEIEVIDAEILAATEVNMKAQKYTEYIDYIKEVDAAKQAAEDAEIAYQEIVTEIKEMISKVKFPDGISISSDGVSVMVDGFPMDRGQISTSKLYTAALRIAAMNLGEVRSVYFDASFCDRNTLQEIHAWAVANDLQLLIERPAYDGGEISYELIEG